MEKKEGKKWEWGWVGVDVSVGGGCCPRWLVFLCPWHITHTLRLIIGYLSADKQQQHRSSREQEQEQLPQGVVSMKEEESKLTRATPKNCRHLSRVQLQLQLQLLPSHSVLLAKRRSVIFMGRQKERKEKKEKDEKEKRYSSERERERMEAGI